MAVDSKTSLVFLLLSRSKYLRITEAWLFLRVKRNLGPEGLTLLVQSFCHLSRSAAAPGNQCVSVCTAFCFEDGRHPSFRGICDPFDGRLSLAALTSYFCSQEVYLAEMGGLWIWGSQVKQNIPLVLILGICLRPTCLWCLSARFEDCLQFFCEKTCSRVDVEEDCLLKWQLGLTWKKHHRLPDCLSYLSSFCLWCTDSCAMRNEYRWFTSIHSFPSLLLMIFFSFLLCDGPSDLKSPNVNRRSYFTPSWGDGGDLWLTKRGLVYLMGAVVAHNGGNQLMKEGVR